jgi:hypothetical protein
MLCLITHAIHISSSVRAEATTIEWYQGHQTQYVQHGVANNLHKGKDTIFATCSARFSKQQQQLQQQKCDGSAKQLCRSSNQPKTQSLKRFLASIKLQIAFARPIHYMYCGPMAATCAALNRTLDNFLVCPTLLNAPD